MRNTHPFIGIVLLLFVIYKIATYQEPSGDILRTKFLRDAALAVDVRSVAGCSIKTSGVYVESCLLRSMPDLQKLNTVLNEFSWKIAADDKYSCTAVWRKSNGVICLRRDNSLRSSDDAYVLNYVKE